MSGAGTAIRLVGPPALAALVMAALMAAAACAQLPFIGGSTAEGEAAGAPSPPAEERLAAAPVHATQPAPRETEAPTPPPVPTFRPGRLVTVGFGDTVHAISRRYGVAVSTIIAQNDLIDPDWLWSGQRLRLPLGSRIIAHSDGASEMPLPAADAPAPESPAASSLPERWEPAAEDRRAEDRRAEDRRAATRPEPSAAPREARAASASVPLPPSRNTFLWPIEGRVISRFGTKPGGKYNDGINIAVPVGSDIRASRNGVVAYAGNELRGYGNLVLIRHEHGWMTAYAHNDTLLVGKGDVVRRGQVISRSGNSGRVSRPQAHFEIRRDGEPQDPLRLLTHK